MKGILIDENLPAELAAVLSGHCTHANVLGRQLTDEQLWCHAKANDLVILTKDADFFDKLIMHGSPPKVVWVRTGNLRRTDMVTLLSQIWPQVLALLVTADLVELHPGRVEGIKLGPQKQGT
ncbi:MAG: hypothetical protein RIQ79_2172 [Verrucomicrobiota bacterium]|jgi:predicted nuclease of predicted toxin-antitoxin system